jgi:hypothetical protein
MNATIKSILKKQGEIRISLNIHQMITDCLIWWLTPNYSSAKSKIKNVHINSRKIVSVKNVAWLPRSRASGLVRLRVEIGMDLIIHITVRVLPLIFKSRHSVYVLTLFYTRGLEIVVFYVMVPQPYSFSFAFGLCSHAG